MDAIKVQSTTVSGTTGNFVGIGSGGNLADSGHKHSDYALATHSHVIADTTGLQSALDLKAPLASAALTGTPTAPTAALATNTTQLATCAFVRAEVAALVDSAPGTLDTLGELAAALQADESAATTLTTLVGTKLAKASNLSDLTNASTARTNLGLGNAAVLNTGTNSGNIPIYGTGGRFLASGGAFQVDPTGATTATSFSGDGSALTALNAANLTTGRAPLQRLPTEFKFVNTTAGVTGAGTTGSPYVGWEATVNASTAGTTWLFPGGKDTVYQTTAEIRIQASDVHLVGWGATIRSTHGSVNFNATTGNFVGSAVVAFHIVGGGELTGCELAGLTLDGNGVTPIGLRYINTCYSSFARINFRNAVTWCMTGTRAITNTYTNLIALSYTMTTVTTNGLWFDHLDPENPSLNYSTVGVVTAAEIFGLPGVGLRISENAFGMVFNGGAFEGCGQAMEIQAIGDTSVFGCVFNGTDFEGWTTTPPRFGGHDCTWNDLNLPGPTAPLVFGYGHRFVHYNGPLPDLTGCTGPVYFIDPVADLETNWNTGSDIGQYGVLIRNGKTIRTGVNIPVYQSNGGHSVGQTFFCAGHGFAHLLRNDDGTYLIDTGSTLTETQLDTLATVQANAAMRLQGQNVDVYGTLSTAVMHVWKTGIAVEIIKSTDGAGGAFLELFSPGHTQGFIGAADDGNTYVSGGGSGSYVTATVQGQYNLKLDGSRNVTVGDTLTTPTFINSKSGLNIAKVTSTDGTGSVLRLFATGVMEGYAAIRDGYFFLSTDDSDDFTTAHMQTVYGLRMNGRNLVTGGILDVAKRQTSGVVAGGTVGGGTYTANADNGNEFRITISANVTLVNPSGTPVDGQGIVYRIKQDGTGGRTISLDTQFRLPSGYTLPTGLTANKTVYMACEWCAADSKWDVFPIHDGEY